MGGDHEPAELILTDAETGTVMRAGTLKRFAEKAGFCDVEVLPIAKICVYLFSCRLKKSLTATDFGSRLAKPRCSAHPIASKYSLAVILRQILG